MCKYQGTESGYICQRCGEHVMYGAFHDCSGYYHLPQLPLKNYKCPDCKGEFSDPAGHYGNYKCPFCNKKLEGLSDNKY